MKSSQKITGPNTHPLNAFAFNSEKILEQLDAVKSPLILTVDGKAKLVLQDAKSYQALLERVEVIEGLHRGLQDMRAGRVKPAQDVFHEIRETVRP